MTKLMLALAITVLAVSAQAQDITAGDLVRISAPALGVSKAKFRFVSADGDSLRIASANEKHDTSTIARSEITRLEVNHAGATHGHAGGGFLIGGVVGGLFGLTVAATDHELTCAIDGLGGATSCPSGHETEGFLAGFAVGGTMGALIGLAIRSRTWTKADPAAITTAPTVAITPTWTPGKKAVGFAVQLRF